MSSPIKSSPATLPPISPSLVAPGGTVGILGGGQLGRMLTLAAAELGLKTHIYTPESKSPAGQVANCVTEAGYEDPAALARFAEVVDVVTYEFENIPLQTTAFLQERVAIQPDPLALAVAQDRLTEKNFLQQNGIATAPFAAVSTDLSLSEAVERVGCPAVLKTRRLGYDGKGQRVIREVRQAPGAWDSLQKAPALLEAFIEFGCEISVIAARGQDGAIACYDIAQNIHANHILHQTRVPARVSEETAQAAINTATDIIVKLNYVGVMGIEMFADLPGPDAPNLLMVNEIAPRVHNSGHWTLDACPVSQFEQHMRAICGWPLGGTARAHNVVMTNLLGEEWRQWRSYAQDPNASLHLYGKKETRPGRKMGHVTELLPLDS